jgi:hypothetical protein
MVGSGGSAGAPAEGSGARSAGAAATGPAPRSGRRPRGPAAGGDTSGRSSVRSGEDEPQPPRTMAASAKPVASLGIGILVSSRRRLPPSREEMYTAAAKAATILRGERGIGNDNRG